MSKSISLMIFQFGKIKAFYVRKPDKCLGMIVVIMLSKQYTILSFILNLYLNQYSHPAPIITIAHNCHKNGKGQYLIEKKIKISFPHTEYIFKDSYYEGTRIPA